ncbi:MAG: Asp-tRNA(Asn)/Glu-tRNA(Gln) amidotransferase subunit GatC [bacterium]
MSSINPKQVSRIAELANLTIEPATLDETTAGLNEVLTFVEQLQAVDASGIEPTSQVTGLIDVLRDDVVIRSPISRDELLKRSPHHTDGQIVVKRVLK